MKSLTSVGFHQNNRQPVNSFSKPHCKPVQHTKNNPNSSHPIYFGLGSASMFIAAQASNSLLGKGIQGMIDDSEKLAKLGNLSEDLNYRHGMNCLKLSQAGQAENSTEKQVYLKQAEKAFRLAAEAQKYHVLAMTCWVYAAQCAKAGGRSPGVVDQLCENAENAFDESRDQILKERAELMVPYKPSNIARLLLSSPLLLATSLYMFFKPDRTRTARTYLIKSGYGQNEWARVEQNQNLAKRFNNASQGLLDIITNLHSNHIKREFNTRQCIPPEVPLWTFPNSQSKEPTPPPSPQSVFSNPDYGAIRPYDASIPGDIV